MRHITFSELFVELIAAESSEAVGYDADDLFTSLISLCEGIVFRVIDEIFAADDPHEFRQSAGIAGEDT